ncbi:hypothetical protein BJ912DRAFT_989460 [Pholiota molesta]|nr:hypothetical protein BJ912DRAFT_989460 [Pholiota molesta]
MYNPLTERLAGKDEYPSAVVLSIRHDQHLWCTIGPPIRTSRALLGRGKHIWLVREYVPGDNKTLPSLNGDEMSMKTAWRNNQKTPESMIYSSIKLPVLGLVKFECGGDAIFSGVTGYPMTVRNLRSNFLCDYEDPTSETPVLHRLILSTVGRPMWSYTTDLDLLTGFRDALQAHQRLCDRRILHRDISADNILLSKDSTAPFRGFIIDLDFVHIDDLTIQQPEVTLKMNVIRQNRFLSPEPMTRTHPIFEGTPQFMSRALLLQAENGVTRFVHGPNDDVESFIWVLSYCVMRNLHHQASHHALEDIRDQSASLQSVFREAFGQVTAWNLASHRHSNADALEFPITRAIDKIIEAFMSEALIDLFVDFQVLLADAHKPRPYSTPLTHDILLTKVGKAIAKLDGVIRSPTPTNIPKS